MVEERNENLHDADGKDEQKNAPQSNQNQNDKNEEVTKQKKDKVTSHENKQAELEKELIEEEKKVTEETEKEALNDKSVEQVVSEIEDNMASDSEKHDDDDDEHHIPLKSYFSFEPEALIEEAKQIISENPVQKIKKHIEEIKSVFLDKIEKLKEGFEEESEEYRKIKETERSFFDIYKDYKKQLKDYYNEIQERLNTNLEKRKDIIEELKRIIDSTEYNFEQRLKKFKDLQKAWRTAGAVPRNEYSEIWNNFRHHEARFYDLLDLDREYRDKVFQKNLEEKKEIIEAGKKLLKENDIHQMFVQLQNLHKRWKEETGPVSREYREQVWEEFKDITKQIHDKRRDFYKKLKEQFGDNLIKKQEIIEKLKEIAENLPDTHKLWQETIKKVEELREEFYQIGFVPKKNREEIWDAFKSELKTINKQKNNYYKSLKELQKENLDKKNKLIQIANEWKDSEDWETATEKFKQIQQEWKNIGHVPRRVSEKVWKEFREACNYYFDRFHSEVKKSHDEEYENFLKKKEFLRQLKEKFSDIPEDQKFSIDDIKQIQKDWKELGYVPHHKRYINAKFNKYIDTLFDKLNVDKRELSFLKFKNMVDEYLKDEKFYKLDQEKRYVRQKIENIEKEIQQLENNSLFIVSNDANNMFKKEIDKKRKNNKGVLDFWKKKLNYLNSLNY